jgi:Inorganic Pyrophosphatase
MVDTFDPDAYLSEGAGGGGGGFDPDAYLKGSAPAAAVPPPRMVAPQMEEEKLAQGPHDTSIFGTAIPKSESTYRGELSKRFGQATERIKAAAKDLYENEDPTKPSVGHPFRTAGDLYDIASSAVSAAASPITAALYPQIERYTGIPGEKVAGALGAAGARAPGGGSGLWRTERGPEPVTPGVPAPSALSPEYRAQAGAQPAPETPPPAPAAPPDATEGAPAATTRPGLDPNVRLLPPDLPAGQPLRDSVGAARATTALEQASPEAVGILENLVREEGWTEHTLDQLEADQSPHHFLAESSPQFEQLTKANQTLPGAARNEINQTVNQRHRERGERVNQIHSEYLHEDVDRTQWEAALRKAAQEESAPFWTRFDQMVVQPTDEIDAVLQRPTMRKALAATNRTLLDRGQPIENGFPVLMEEEGGNSMRPSDRIAAEKELEEKRVPTAKAFQLAKEHIDGLIADAVRNGRRGDVRTYTGLKADLDKAIADHPNSEIADTWKQARQTYRGPMALVNAREIGEGLLTGNTHYTEVPGIVEGMSPEERAALLLGVRNHMADIGGRPGAGAQLRNIREALGPDNRRKIEALIGQDRADEYFSALQHEENMHFAPGRLTKGSDTAANIAFRELLEPPGTQGRLSKAVNAASEAASFIASPKKYAAKKALEAVQRGEEARAGAEAQRFQGVREDLGRLLMTQGAERDAIRRELVRRIQEGEGGLGGPEMGRQPLERDVVKRDSRGRPLQTKPFNDRGDQAILEAGHERATNGATAGAEQAGLRGRGELPGGQGQLEAPRGTNPEAGSRSGPAPGEPLSGLPTSVTVPGLGKISVGPHQPIRDLAEKYMQDAGLPYNPPRDYAKVDVARAARIADEYEKMAHAPNDPAVKKAYDAMAKETMAQWEAIKRSGFKAEFIPPGAPDPYAASPRLAVEDIKKNNHMWVFSTRDGFGTDVGFDPSSSPLLNATGETISGQPALVNDIFRIVHDYFGHAKEGVGFRADGEENAWRSHAAMYSPEARRAMTSETRGQNSWLNYGPHGEANRTAKTAETVFADQKTGLMPEWVSNEGSGQALARQVLQRDARGRPLETAPLRIGREADVLRSGYNLATGENPSRISQRLPTSKRAEPTPENLSIDVAAAKQTPEAYEHNVDLLRPLLPYKEGKNVNPDKVASSFVNHVSDNLKWLYNQVPPDIRERSKLWYEGGRQIVDNWVKDYGVKDSTAAAVIAALSPQKDWFQNVSLAHRVLEIVKNKADIPFSPEMKKAFDARPSLERFKPLIQLLEGKSLRDIEGLDLPKADRSALTALWTRIYDEAHHSPEHHLITPEGGASGLVRTGAGEPAKIGWGSLDEIGKAITAIKENGNPATLNTLLGAKHKVRNFYNNLLSPNSKLGDVTIDTHAVAAALLRPLSGQSVEVSHNFGNYPGQGITAARYSASTGVEGTYPFYADAYRKAAKELGILPRELQSITWEAVRGLFQDTRKTALKPVVDKIWGQYRTGRISLDDARQQIKAAAAPNGIPPPAWYGHGGEAAEAGGRGANAEELPGSRVSREATKAAGRRGEGEPAGLATGGRVGAPLINRKKYHYGQDRGTNAEHCGNCSMFRAPHKCSAVGGFIAKMGKCDIWERPGRADGGATFDERFDTKPSFSERLYRNKRGEGNIEDRRGDQATVGDRIKSAMVTGARTLEHVFPDLKGPLFGKDYKHEKQPGQLQSDAGYDDFARGGAVEPTDAQKEAGNYKKHHIRMHGLDIAIENAKGSTRSGAGKDGKQWSVTMPAHYGYIKRTEGADGDHVDCYVGPHTGSGKVFIVDQRNAETGNFDEHKCFIGFGSAAQVRSTYNRGFSDGKGPKRLGHITELTVDQFKRWLRETDDMRKPAHVSSKHIRQAA